MSELPNIDSKESLEAWLSTRPREDVALVRSRVAMRVFPRWLLHGHTMSEPVRDKFMTTVLRAILAQKLRVEVPIRGFANAVDVSLTDGIINEADAVYFVLKGDGAENLLIVSDVPTPYRGSRLAIHREVVWPSIQADVEALIRGDDLFAMPLWHGENPFAREWKYSQRILRGIAGGDFWIDWYQRALDGRPQNWPLLRDVALIDDELWEEAGPALDAAIRELRERHALAATANGERIERNPDSGRLRLVPDAAWPQDAARYARRKIVKAIGLFENQSGQIYGALDDDRAMLRRVIEDADNLPVELYDACASALRRLDVRVRNGECPPADRDALIGDYRDRLRDAAADILGSDPETASVLQRRAAVVGNDALIDAREAVLEVVAAAGPLLEGRLADTLPKDAEAATRSDTPPEERGNASFRLAGRMLRIFREVGRGFAHGNKGLVGVANYLQAMEYLATSPTVQAVSEAIFRFLGL